MTLRNIDFLTNVVVIVASLFSIVYTFGVVWRVEKKLDLSYKLFLISILAFTSSVIIEISNPLNDRYLNFSADLMKMLFAIFFLAGILEMRNMIRHIDGEK